MNDVVFIKEIKSSADDLQNPAYRSIIYCFLGKITVTFENRAVDISAGKFAVVMPNQAFKISVEESSCGCYLGLSEPSFGLLETIVVSDEKDFRVGALLTQCLTVSSEKDKREILLPALGNLLAAYIFVLTGKSGNLGIVETVQNKIKEEVGNPDFKLEEYLKSLPLNSDYVKKLFKNQTGFTPKQRLAKLRLDKAKMLLSGTDRLNYTIKEVSNLCGYSDSLYFSKIFKNKFSYSPTEYAHRFDKPTKKKAPLGVASEVDI